MTLTTKLYRHHLYTDVNAGNPINSVMEYSVSENVCLDRGVAVGRIIFRPAGQIGACKRHDCRWQGAMCARGSWWSKPRGKIG